MPALKDIFQFERWLEEGFKEILTGNVENIFTSLDTATAQSPRIVIRAVVEGINGKHEHVFTDGGEDEGGHFRSVFDAYDAIIENAVGGSGLSGALVPSQVATALRSSRLRG